jgi:hypothetical protein
VFLPLVVFPVLYIDYGLLGFDIPDGIHFSHVVSFLEVACGMERWSLVLECNWGVRRL